MEYNSNPILNPVQVSDEEKAEAKADAVKREYAKRADRLADWTFKTLTCRTDTYGKYYIDKKTNTLSNCRALSKRKNPEDKAEPRFPLPLDREAMLKHWRGEHTVGLYTTDPEDMVKCVVIDLDNHEGDKGSTNFSHLREMCGKLKSIGCSFVAYSSDGKGGFHLWVPFAEKIPFRQARPFGLWLADSKFYKSDPEVNPKGGVSHTKEKCGNYVRLMLPKPGKTNWPDFWTGEKWVWGKDVPAVVDHLLGVEGNDPAVIPAAALEFKEPERIRPAASCAGAGVDLGEAWWKEVRGDLSTLDLKKLFDDRGWLVSDEGTEAVVRCPWSDEHSTQTTGTKVWQGEGQWPGFNCLHAHCEGKGLREVVEFFGADVVSGHCSREFGRSAYAYFTDEMVEEMARRANGRAKVKVNIEDIGAGLPVVERKTQGRRVPSVVHYIARGLDQYEWIIPGKIRKGVLAILGGDAKAGKTTCLYNTFSDMILKRCAWGEICRPVPVIHLDFETDPTFIKNNMFTVRGYTGEDMAAIGKYFHATDSLDPDPRLCLPDYLTTDYLDEIVKDHDTPGIIVPDTLRAAMSAFPDIAKEPAWDFNANLVRKVLRPYLQWAHKTGWTVLFTAHNNSQGRLYGSVDFKGVADQLLYLTRDVDANGKKTSNSTLEIEGRMPSCHPLHFTFDEGVYEYMGTVAPEHADFVALFKEPMTVAQIMEATSYGKNKAYKLVTECVRSGRLKQTNKKASASDPALYGAA